MRAIGILILAIFLGLEYLVDTAIEDRIPFIGTQAAGDIGEQNPGGTPDKSDETEP